MYLALVILAILVCLCFHTLLFVVPLTPCDGIVALLKGIAVAGILIERERGVGTGIDIQCDRLVGLGG